MREDQISCHASKALKVNNLNEPANCANRNGCSKSDSRCMRTDSNRPAYAAALLLTNSATMAEVNAPITSPPTADWRT